MHYFPTLPFAANLKDTRPWAKCRNSNSTILACHRVPPELILKDNEAAGVIYRTRDRFDTCWLGKFRFDASVAQTDANTVLFRPVNYHLNLPSALGRPVEEPRSKEENPNFRPNFAPTLLKVAGENRDSGKVPFVPFW